MKRCNIGSFTLLSKNQIKAIWYLNKIIKNESHENITEKLSTLNIQDYDYTKDEDLKNKVDLNTLCLMKRPNVKIELEALFESTIQIMELYFICDGCGHIYWVKEYLKN